MGVSWRLLVTEPLDGATNMAIDEALLRARIAGEAGPTVRFFAWASPTVSLGYGQPLDAGIDLAACGRLGLDLVRRPTGGSAILHEGPAAELTYSVVAGGDDFVGADELLETYRVIGAGLVAGLGRLGLRAELVPRLRGRSTASPAFCFARAGSYEIAAAGRKLVGSAQRRQGGAFLQQGSVLLGAGPERLRAVFPGLADPLAGVTTVTAALGHPVTFDEVAAALADGLGEVLGRLAPGGGLTPGEAELVRSLVADKYATEAWTRHGQPSAVARA
jgi:lipoate-protein ligase A